MSQQDRETIKWGYLRETKVKAKGYDEDTGYPRTCMGDYLKVIFPEVDDWIHDSVVPNLLNEDGTKCTKRPDFRSEQLKTIIEIDDPEHYKFPNKIDKDKEKDEIFSKAGYKIVRIPYFIQLSNNAVKVLFDRVVEEPLFNESIPSMGIKGNNCPACLTHAGIVRMAKEFKLFPAQYETNINYLKSLNDEYHTGVNMLIYEYNKNK